MEVVLRILERVEEDCAVVLSPVTFTLSVASQEKEDATLEVSAILTAFPLHTVAEEALVMAGVGFTVTVTVWAVPAHPFALGVTEYVAVPCEFPVVVKLWAIEDPLDAEPPVTPL